MRNDEYGIRNAIFGVLMNTYSMSDPAKNEDWYYHFGNRSSYTSDLAKQITTDILALYAFTKIDPEHNKRAKYYGETFHHEVTNTIWNNWSGGGTAANAATKICKILGEEVDTDG